MSLAADFKILLQLLKRPAGDTHAARLESFYASQAEGYDEFRKRLLPARDELFTSLAARVLDASGHAGADASRRLPNWVDLGGGTGANIECIESSLPRLGSVMIVDLSTSLLEIAGRRIAERRWSNVTTIAADVTTYQPTDPADVVTFSYSLTMIPDWLSAIDRAAAMLRPGGLIGVVDFYVSHKHPPAVQRRHGWWTRTFWPAWFAFDNVYLGPDRLTALQSRFETVELDEKTARVPYVPLGRVPYFRFLGRKR